MVEVVCMELTRYADKKWCRILPSLAIIFTLGCASAPGPSVPTKVVLPEHPLPVQTDVTHKGNPSKASSKASAPASDDLQLKLRAAVQQWLGTPHRMGGNSHRGIDCSGFVQHLYKQVYGKSIPRSSTLQVKQGHPISKNQLVPGDLVFFKPPYKINHVGIYLGNQQFAHASASKGVIISDLTDHYWRDCYWTSRRYLNL